MDREEATEEILQAKREAGLTFTEIAEKLGRPKVWTTAALLGQHPMGADEAETVADLLGLDDEAVSVLQEVPMRGSLDADVPTDPTIYRLHEVTQVYGTTIKALIHEEFGDGIMSAINFNMDIEKVEHAGGDRVRITYEGKFFPTSGIEVGAMIPGELLPNEGDVELNAGRETKPLTVANTGDRPIQVGSHFHFFEVNKALRFDREEAYGLRLAIPAGTSTRFEPGDEREVDLVPIGGRRIVHGLNGLTEGALDDPEVREAALRRAHEKGFVA